jgi:hypothetical protein
LPVVNRRISARCGIADAVQYKYVDLGSATVNFPGVPLVLGQVATEGINQRYQLLTLGLNYKQN